MAPYTHPAAIANAVIAMAGGPVKRSQAAGSGA